MAGRISHREPSLARAGSRGLFLATLIFSVFTNLLMLTGPLFMLQIYDRVLGSRSEETLVALSILVAALFALYGLLEFARGRVMARVGARFQASLDDRVFRAVLEDVALHHRGKGGIRATQDLDSIRTFFTAPVLLALFDLPWTPVFLTAIFIFHPYLGWLAVGGGTLLILATLLNQLFTAKKVAEAQKQAIAALNFSKQSEGAGELIWAQGMVGNMVRRWTGLQDSALEGTIRANDWTGSFSAFTKSFRLFLQSAILALGAWLVLRGELTAGAMIAGSILLGRALAPIELAVSQWPVVQRARAGWIALGGFLAAVPSRDEPIQLPAPAARLEVRGVSVAVRGSDRPVLQGVSLDVAPGEAIGVIGKSGAGKTSLARVILGLVAPQAGIVRLDGATLDQYGPERLGQFIGYLPQEIRLFEGTVAENIAHMAPEPDTDRVLAAAMKARAHEIILGLPNGYDTRIGEADAQLSGGQKQRVALARALYADPVLLVLDEPNSALDAEGSEALNAVIEAMKADQRAVIIMTHRPTAISACDRLLILDGGRVAAYGPRDEIIKSMIRNAGDVQRVIARRTQS